MKSMSPHIYLEYQGGKTRCQLYSFNSASAPHNPNSKGLFYLCIPSRRSRPLRHSPHDHCSSWGKAQRCRHRLSRRQAHSCGSCSPGSSETESCCRETTRKGTALLFPASASTASCWRLKGAFPKLVTCKQDANECLESISDILHFVQLHFRRFFPEFFVVFWLFFLWPLPTTAIQRTDTYFDQQELIRHQRCLSLLSSTWAANYILKSQNSVSYSTCEGNSAMSVAV